MTLDLMNLWEAALGYEVNMFLGGGVQKLSRMDMAGDQGHSVCRWGTC